MKSKSTSVLHSLIATSENKPGMTFIHFRRLLGYTWPHKRYLVPALFCVLLMAVTYSISIGSLLPVMKVMIEDEGLHGWVYRHVGESRLKGLFSIYSYERGAPIEGGQALDRKKIVVREIRGDPADPEERSPLWS